MIPELAKKGYNAPTREEKEQAEKAESSARQAAQEARAALSRCLTAQEFIEYRERYENVEKKMVELLIAYREPDPVRYAFEVSNMLRELGLLRSLLADVKRGVKEDGAS